MSPAPAALPAPSPATLSPRGAPTRPGWTIGRLALAAAVLLGGVTGCGILDGPTAGNGPLLPTTLAATVTVPPGNLTITPTGRIFLSLHQNYAPTQAIVELDATGQPVAFPRAGQEAMPPLVTVLGLRSDTAGVLWILDNGNRGATTPKIVAYDTRAGRLLRTIPLPRPVTDTNSFVNDLDFDYPRNQLHITDPAGGANAALIVVDLATGRARRVLQGHPSVVPSDTTWTVRGKALVQVRPNGQRVRPTTGVDGLALDAAREWLYYGALDSRSLYRVRAADLADASLTDAQLAARVERYSAKPPSDGIRIDVAGNIYLGDLTSNAFGVIRPDRVYRQIAQSDSAAWFDDFEFGTDGQLYLVDTQLHLSPPLNAGTDAARRPFRIFATLPLAPLPAGY